jgi:hypothetical protein
MLSYQQHMNEGADLEQPRERFLRWK